MKQVFFVLAAACCWYSCAPEAAKTPPEGVTVTMPYTPTYSASFRIGNAELATKVVQGSWKDWENNQLDSLRNWVADSIVVVDPENKTIKGLDSVIANWKRGRARYKSTTPSINGVVPIYSTDQGHDWVLVAAMEITETLEGVGDTVWLMENWRFNKDGKADFLRQYMQRTPK
ncbi:MAG TPA: hypothetical protein PKE63_07140 [Lacibacter sp.]|nr:hypothetical protein [Lacibacter sp.]